MNEPGTSLPDLIAAHLDGELSSAQREELNRTLRSSDSARGAFLAAMRQEILLGEVLRERMERAQPERPVSKAAPARFNWRVVGSLAAAILFAVTLVALNRTPTQIAPPVLPASAEPTLATITAATKECLLRRDNIPRPATIGMELRATDCIETADAATLTLRYADGTTVSLQERTAAEFFVAPAGGKSIALEKGALQADVAKQPPGQPMVLSTVDAEATVLGTRFTLSAEIGQSTLAVDEGRVRFTRVTDRKSVEVATGSVAVISAAAAEIVLNTKSSQPPPPSVPKPDARPEVLLVTAERIPFFAHDVALKSILEEMEFKVIEKRFDEVKSADAAGKVLIVIPSHRCLGTRVFSETPVPAICWHAVWYEDLGMCDPAASRSHNLKTQRLKFAEHPVTAGIVLPDGPTAQIPVYASGQPTPRAQIIASIIDQPSKAVIFGYEKDVVMYGFTARARRMGFSIDVRETNGRDAPVDIGKQLLIASVKWATSVEKK